MIKHDRVKMLQVHNLNKVNLLLFDLAATYVTSAECILTKENKGKL